jgi:anaphase-promoting complex subunit 2
MSEENNATAPEFENVALKLRDMEWMERLEEAFYGVLYEVISTRTRKKVQGVYDRQMLKGLIEWFNGVIDPWMKMLLGDGQQGYNQWLTRLDIHMYETLCDLRIEELFDIITDGPKGLAAIEDLRACLSRTHQQAKLVKQLRSAFQRRLLIAGAPTSNIILTYIYTIKHLRILDPSGVLLESVNEPIREYLRNRHDTVKKIIEDLTKTDGELHRELGNSDLNGTQNIQGEYEDDENACLTWQPDSWEADPKKTSTSRRSMDIISLLVDIYGSTELFVNEYRSMLAEKLIANREFKELMDEG